MSGNATLPPGTSPGYPAGLSDSGRIEDGPKLFPT